LQTLQIYHARNAVYEAAQRAQSAAIGLWFHSDAALSARDL
jgi:hypothetical protein